MHLPGTPALAFLFLILFLLPAVALRSAAQLERMRNPDGSFPQLPRSSFLGGSVVVQLILLILSFLVGRRFGFELFAVGPLGTAAFAIAVLAFAACLALHITAKMFRSGAERRKLFVYQLAPRTVGEWIVWTAVVLLAGVAEEAAYRGVGMAILSYALGNPWVAALISSIAFALAHSIQGWKSTVVIFLIAGLMHGLVAITGTLVLAMGVHVIYDLVVGWLISNEAARFEPVEEVAAHSEGTGENR